jgi:transcription termination factor Rho
MTVSDTTDLLATDDGHPTENPTASDTTLDAGPARARRRGTGLAGMLLPELQQLAASLGVTGVARMRKGELVAAIEAKQGGTDGGGEPATAAAPERIRDQLTLGETGPREPTTFAVEPGAGDEPRRDQRGRRAASRPAGPPVAAASTDPGLSVVAAAEPDAVRTAEVERPDREGRAERPDRRDRRGDHPNGDRGDRVQADRSGEPAALGERGETGGALGDRAQGDRGDRSQGDRARGDRAQGDRVQADRSQGDRSGGERAAQGDRSQGDRAQADRSQGDRAQADRSQGDRSQGDRNQADRSQADRSQGDRSQGDRSQSGDGGSGDRDDDGYEGGGRRRRGRFRDRRRGRDRFGGDAAEPVIAEDDVLLPVAGILDILDNYAFVRTSGYLTGPNDVYVSLAQVRRYGLRRGDAITGAVRQPRDGERRDKYNALVRLDTINGMDLEQAKTRPEFTKLTPLYPQERLRLETEPHLLTTRVIDLVMPIGKGQRALIVSPPKAGKTMVLQAVANAITTNNPECHLMVVLVDERPEEVTDMQRSVKGEVIASTFDRPPTDHTTVAELSIERAKRLVEMGHDVVVLLDSITRLGRAYNLAAPASGRILSGGVDSTALYPPKRFLGAARNIENGGSLTILATALVETGSVMDTVIFEEFKGTGNAELKLDRKIADKRVFPAIDVDASGTRKEEILLAPEELAILHKLRRVLHALETQQALDLLLERIKQTRTNVEFLMQVQKTTVGPQD